MAIYFKDISCTVFFGNDINTITEETYFTKEVSKLKIGIMIRDCEIGRAGNSTSHQGAPSIKIFDMGKGRKANHSRDGDPVYFTYKGHPSFEYEGYNKLDSIEEKYIKNFINHNYLNLMMYWFAPIKCETREFCNELQHEIQRRIQYNINKFDYAKNSYPQDSKVFISERVRKRLNVSRNNIDWDIREG